MRMLHVLIALAWLPAVAACGGGSSSPTSPTTAPPAATTPPASTPAPTATPAPGAPSNFGVFTFSFDAGTSVADQALIGEGVQIANDYFISALGRTLANATQIRGVLSATGCGQGGTGGAAAFTGGGSVTICMANQGWTTHGPITKRKIVIHEVYHLLQFERRWLGLPTQASSGAMWLVEGAPELVAYRALDSRGLLPYSTARGCQVKEYTDFGLREPPGLPNLSAIEATQAWNQTRGPLYALAMTGVDQLVTARGLSALNTYMDAIAAGGFQTAFQAAFGQTAAAFYDQFPAYRSSLTVPPTYQCSL
jgi:hypothetical protein